jgi:hypothetical protein
MRCVIVRFLVEDVATGEGDILEITLTKDPCASEAFHYDLRGTVPPRWIKSGGNTLQLENFVQTSGLYDVIARERYGLLGGVSTP